MTGRVDSNEPPEALSKKGDRSREDCGEDEDEDEGCKDCTARQPLGLGWSGNCLVCWLDDNLCIGHSSSSCRMLLMTAVEMLLCVCVHVHVHVCVCVCVCACVCDICLPLKCRHKSIASLVPRPLPPENVHTVCACAELYVTFSINITVNSPCTRG